MLIFSIFKTYILFFSNNRNHKYQGVNKGLMSKSPGHWLDKTNNFPDILNIIIRLKTIISVKVDSFTLLDTYVVIFIVTVYLFGTK